MSGLSDSFQRPINYLRISVTDRCNLRCIYCMPAGGISLLPRSELLTYEEIYHIVRIAVGLGITRVRISGGEPLVRAGLVHLLRLFGETIGLEDISLTTNGILLERYADQLRQAGLHRVNVSLDSLRRTRFESITGYDGLDQVLRGIAAAHEAGLNPVKINMVVMRGINDDEVVDFAARSRDEGWLVRFIELMPFGGGSAGPPAFVPVIEIKRQIAALGELEPSLPPRGNGPAKYYRLPGARGNIGFITPVSEHFCFGCNRLRLTADGRLLPCLLSEKEIDLREPLRGGAAVEDLVSLFEKAVASKPKGHLLAEGVFPLRRPMPQVGG